MKTKAITAIILGGVPLAIIITRHLALPGWVITLLLLLIWLAQVKIMLYFIGREHVKHAPDRTLVQDFMMNDSIGSVVTRQVVSCDEPAQQWHALEEFGVACFKMGETTAACRQQE